MINFNITEKKIIKYIIENKKVFQNDIQKDLDIDKANLSRFLTNFIAEEILIKEKIGKKNILSFNQNKFYIINFEWNREKIKFFISNLYGEIIEELPLSIIDFNDFGSFYKLINKDIIYSLEKYDKKIICISFIIHGIVSNEYIIKHIQNCPWKNINLKDIINNITNIDLLVENYTNLGALYEKLLYYPDYSSLALVKLKTGIGGGLIIDNKIYNGNNGGTLEIGHLTISPDSEIEYVDLIENPFIQENLKKYNFKNIDEFVREYKNGNTKAIELYKLFFKNWIFILKNLNSVINPSVLVIYNIIFNDLPHSLFEIRSAFEKSIVRPEIIEFSKIKLDEYYKGINILLFNKKFNLNISKMKF